MQRTISRVHALLTALLALPTLFGQPVSAAGNEPPGSANQVSTDPVWAASLPGPKLANRSVHLQGQAPQLYSHGNPTPAEQYMLELINRARANPPAEAASFGIDLNEGVEEQIPPEPKPPLALNVNLIDSARLHSQWMLDNNKFSHDGEGGSDPGQRMTTAGYDFIGNWTWGENIAWRGSSVALDPNTTVKAIHADLFIDSSVPGRGHRINLLRDSFREMGVGVRQGPYLYNGMSLNAVMVTHDFAASDAQSGPLLVGVVFKDKNGDAFYSPGEGLAGVTVKPGGAFYAVTSDSGGFAIPLSATSGTLSVTISGGPVAEPITKTIALADHNLKLDFNTAVDRPDPPSLTMTNPRVSPDGRFTFELHGPTGSAVMVQSSDDLSSWGNQQSVTLGTGTTFVDATPVSGRLRRYYRLSK